MTLDQAIAQRDEILSSMGVQRSQYQGRMIEYPTGDARLKELAYLEELIDKLQATGGNPTRCTLATFKRG